LIKDGIQRYWTAKLDLTQSESDGLRAAMRRAAAERMSVTAGGYRCDPVDNPWNLTASMATTLRMRVRGMSTEQIAEAYGVCAKTVCSQLLRVVEIMGVSGTTRAAILWDRFERSTEDA
jgi:DNA-binding NarL/FixJ family response regulator